MSGERIVQVGIGVLMLVVGIGALVHLAGAIHAAHGGGL